MTRINKKAFKSAKKHVFFRIKIQEYVVSKDERAGVFRFSVLKAESILISPKKLNFKSYLVSDYIYDRKVFIKELAFFVTLFVDARIMPECVKTAREFIESQKHFCGPIQKEFGPYVDFIREVRNV